MENNKIVHVQLDNWYDMGKASKYLEELENGEHDKEINYSSVWYDMAIVYCITTTEEYAIKHNIEERIKFADSTIFGPYFPEYDETNFGCQYDGEYEYSAPYKDFNKQINEAIKNKQNNN